MLRTGFSPQNFSACSIVHSLLKVVQPWVYKHLDTIHQRPIQELSLSDLTAEEADTQQTQLATDIQRLLEPLPCTSISRSSSSFEMSALLAYKTDNRNQLDLQRTRCQEYTLGKVLHDNGCETLWVLLQRQDCNL